MKRDERAQSVTLGFVIMMGIVLSASIIYLSIQIPEWTKGFEAEHASKVQQDFALLASSIDSAALSEDPTAFGSCAIGMAPETVPFVGIHAAGGTLTFDNSSERFECVAYAPGEAPPHNTNTYWWNSTPADFPAFDKFHVDVYPEAGAELQLETGENITYHKGGENYTSGEFWCNNFIVTNNTTLYTPWLTVHAKNIFVGPNSSINASGLGMAGGTTIPEWGTPLSANGSGEGGGKIPVCRHPYSWLDYCYCGAGGGGAGHYSPGGSGGYSWTGSGPFCSDCGEQNHSGGAGGTAYANIASTVTDRNVTYPGSGGACAAWGQVACIESDGCYLFEGGAGGDGGGVIVLDAPVINISGLVTVDGEDGHYSNDWDRAEDSAGGGGGGGSGGTILLKGGNISIFGNLSAKGGNGADGAKACDRFYNGTDTDTYNSAGGGGGGGGGGVIKIFGDLYAQDGLDNHTNVSGGAGGLGGRGNGTYCDDICYPNPSGNGAPGGPGFVYHQSYPDYTPSVPHYRTGYLISEVFDAGYNKTTGETTSMINYGTLTWTATKPSGTNIVLKVRTATNPNMTGAVRWEDCPEVTSETDISDLSSVSDGHRYIQWRADLYSFERSRTPVLHTVNISYKYGMPVLVNSSGSIQFNSQYLYLPNFRLVYAHGACIKNQSADEFMLLPPPVSINKDNHGNISLVISSVNLTGSEKAASGVFSSAVKTSFRKSALLADGLHFLNITLNITTEYPTAWCEWFNDTCREADLEYTDAFAPGKYSIITATGTVSVVFYGNETRPVRLWLKEVEVEVGLAV